MDHLVNYFRKIFTVDLRALALMRIGIGFILLLDLFIRATDLKAHYSNEGVLPLHVLFKYNWNPWHISLHTISGAWQIQAILFAVAATFALFVLIGYKTRLSTIVSWVLLFSLQNRNPLILQGGDDLLRMTLFWCMFLPWGKYYSVDTFLPSIKATTKTYFSAATAGFILQILSVYFFSALLKSSPEWRTEGTAIYYALSLDQIVFPIGKMIYNYPLFLKYTTLVVFYVELLVPLLIFIPWFNKQFRIAVILILTGLHIGISSTLFVGLFFMIGIVTLMGFYPSSWMDNLDNRIYSLKQRFPQFNRSFFTTENLQETVINSNKKKVHFAEGAIILCVLYSLLWNWQSTSIYNFKLPESTTWVARLCRIDQCWGMFSPSVFKDDGWYILEGITPENKIIDLNRNGAPVNYHKPNSVVSLFKNDRWRKYSENYLFVRNNYMRPYFCDFKLKEWNDFHPDNKIKNLKVVYMKEVTLPDYKFSAPKREVLSYTNHRF